MSSNLFAFESSVFFNTFSQSIDSRPDGLPFENSQEIQENNISFIENNNSPDYETRYFDQISSVFLASSPPSAQIDDLSSLSHMGKTEHSALELKTEESHLNSDSYSCYRNSSFPNSFDVADETELNCMHRSYYSFNSFQNKQKFSFRPCFDNVLESQNLHNQILTSPRGSFSSVDLQKEKASPLSTDNSLNMEANCKVVRYSSEERKGRIDRYRDKRSRRNFNKKIKYACRKTLADNRVRVRGRFVRCDEVGKIL